MPALKGYPSEVQEKLEALAAMYPNRDFWWVNRACAPAVWCSGLTGQTGDLDADTAEGLREKIRKVTHG